MFFPPYFCQTLSFPKSKKEMAKYILYNGRRELYNLTKLPTLYGWSQVEYPLAGSYSNDVLCTVPLRNCLAFDGRLKADPNCSILKI